jgi:hypothetical protein
VYAMHAARIAVAVLVISGSSALAQTSTDPKVRKAIDYLADPAHAREVFSVMHFGSTLKDFDVNSLHAVGDGAGNAIPGRFALKVTYKWDGLLGADSTVATFFFDKDGFIYRVDTRSTSVVSPPFELANATIKIVGELLMAAGDPTDEQQRQLRHYIDNADSRGLLLLSMNVRLLAGL